MIRILHVLDAAADFQNDRCVEHLTRQLGDGFATQSLQLGWPRPQRNALAAYFAVRRQAAQADVVHAWGTRALLAAAMARPRRLVFSPGPDLATRPLKWLRAVMDHRDVHVVCPTATARSFCVRGGVAAARCHVVRPAVDFSRVRPRNPAMRQALGYREDDVVILVAGHAHQDASLKVMIWAVGILNELDTRHKLLLWGRGPRAEAVASLNDRLLRPAAACMAEQHLRRPVEYEHLPGAADMALVVTDDPVSILAICVTMASALPIVASAASVVGELLEDRHTALMVPKPTPRLLAQRVLDMEADPRLRWQLGDMARTEAYEYFSLVRFLDDWRAVYAQIAAGQQVSVPPRVPGAGSKFHGRA